MRLNKTDTIAGFPVRAVRDMLRRHYSEQVRPERWPHELHTSPAKAKRLLGELERIGYLARGRYPDSWEMTEQGTAFQLARLTQPFRRETAARALAGLIARARSLEGEDHPYVFRVQEIRVFGSFLREDVDRVGDLDVGLDLAKRYADPARQDAETRKRWHASTAPARNIADLYARPMMEVLRFLKAKSPVISLQPIAEQGEFWDGIPWRTVYELPPVLPESDPAA